MTRDFAGEYARQKARGYRSGRMTISVNREFHAKLVAYAKANGDRPGSIVEAVLLCVLGDAQDLTDSGRRP